MSSSGAASSSLCSSSELSSGRTGALSSESLLASGGDGFFRFRAFLIGGGGVERSEADELDSLEDEDIPVVSGRA